MNPEKFGSKGEYVAAVKHLYNYLRRDGDNFHNLLYHLIGKADPGNFARLRAGFPFEVRAWEMWQDSENEDEFFRTWLEEAGHGVA